jgi:hypothetical protein
VGKGKREREREREREIRRMRCGEGHGVFFLKKQFFATFLVAFCVFVAFL